MYRRLGILAAVLVLSACGGTDPEDGTGSSSGSSSSTSSSSSSSSSSTSSSSSSSSSGSSSGSAVGNPTEGATIWAAQCRNCHGDFDGGISGGVSVVNVASAIKKYDEQGSGGFSSLEEKIDVTMPAAPNPASCSGQCASDVAAYIRSQAAVESFACNAEDPIIYGKRKLVLLTSSQYQAALEDLLGVTTNYGAVVANNDGELDGFAEMSSSSVLDSVAENYIANAEAIAAWAVAANIPFPCTDANTCASEFVDDFAAKVFRRPLTSAEKSAYSDLFSSYGASEGLELALTAALSSPQFLYRSEVGVGVADAIAAGYYANAGGTAGGSSAGGEAETVLAVDFDVKGNGATVQNGVVMMPKNTYNYGLQHNFDREFTDPTLISVVAYGASNASGAWPEMQVIVSESSGGGDVVVGTIVVNSTTEQTYTFTANGITGQHKIKVDFINDNHNIDGDTLYVKSVTLSDVVEQVAVEETPNFVSPLTLAEANAYVLTPYEYAAALSFMLTGSTPDEVLLDAASKDMLTTPAQISAQIERMINSERGKKHFGNFVGTWFKTDNVKTVTRNMFPELTSGVKKAMAQEVREQFKHVFYDDSVPFSEFYNADYTFLNNTLADYYGVPGNFGSGFTKTVAAGRGGPIASGAWMTVWAHAERTSPIRRAVHSRADALCHHIDPPDSPLAAPDIDAQRAAAQKKVEDYEAANGIMSSKAFYYTYTDGITACAGCHERIINPMFGLEDFDNVGRLRASAGSGKVYESLQGTQIEVTLNGSLLGVEAVDDVASFDYVGSKDFSNKIASSDAIHSCLVRKGFRFATGYPASVKDLDAGETLTDEQKEDFGCAETEMKNALMTNNQSPKAMFGKLGLLELVRFRK